MLTDSLYDKCLPILQNAELDDDDRTEKLEDLVKTEASLSGKELENTVLDALWRFRSANSDDSTAIRPPSRHTVVRRASPAPWQVARSTTPASPRPAALTPSAARFTIWTLCPYCKPPLAAFGAVLQSHKAVCSTGIPYCKTRLRPWVPSCSCLRSTPAAPQSQKLEMQS